MALRRELAIEYVRRLKDAPTLTIARKLYNENKSVFTNLEDARTQVRIVRGASGECNKKDHVPELARSPKAPGDPFGKLPKPWEEMPDWSAVQINGPFTCLVLADIHIPFYDRLAIETAVKFGVKRGIDIVLLNGDCWDTFWGSDFQPDPRLRKFVEEREAARQFIQFIRAAFQKQRIIYKIGNHEERVERYFKVKAVELYDDPEHHVKVLLKFADHGVECIEDMRPIRLGELNVLHGHEYRFAIQNPVNPARGLFLRAKNHALCAHFHQSSQHAEKNLEQKVITTWSMGCLCNQHPRYRPLNSWNHGFAIVEADRQNKFKVDNMRIIKGEAYQ